MTTLLEIPAGHRVRILAFGTVVNALPFPVKVEIEPALPAESGPFIVAERIPAP